jgi:SH3-like domain-containing protein
MHRTLAALAAVCTLACRGSEAPRPPAPGLPPAAGATAPGAAQAPAFVTTAAPVRREPTDAGRVKGPAGRDVANAVALLQRGERVAVLDARGDWVRVRTSDDQEGWMKASAVLQGEGIAEATVRAPADVFDRPDLLAANARRKLEPGALLLVVKAKPPFSEVNVSGTTNAWVLTDRLATGERDVSVAKLVEKARWLKRAGKEDEARQILDLARAHFRDEPLLDLLAQELSGAPPGAPPAGTSPDAAQPVPTSGTTP